MTLFRCELVMKGPGRGVRVLLGSDSLRAGKLGVERVGLIDEGGVMELEVSIVEDDLAETSSTLGAGFF